MALAELLSKKKNALAQTETRNLSDKISLDIECSSSDDYFRMMNETQFEKYYETIRPYTFKSALFSLSVPTAKEIRETYKILHPAGGSSSTEVGGFDWRKSELLEKLGQDIDSVKKQFLSTPDVFVRLSSRSPKDAAIGARGVSIYREAKKKIKALVEEMNDHLSTDDNTKLHALYVTGTEALRVQTGAQAVELLINSNRIQEDLEHYFQTPESEFNVVVREFANFEVELEFRGFVYGKKLTAITQYNQFCYFPRVVQKKEQLLEVMKQFVESELIPKVSLPNFVLDIMLVSTTPEEGPYSNLKVYIVEINPFAEFAGEGLFSWTDPAEVDILKGRAPFEFRVVEKPPKDAIKLIDKEWRDFVLADEEK